MNKEKEIENKSSIFPQIIAAFAGLLPSISIQLSYSETRLYQTRLYQWENLIVITGVCYNQEMKIVF
jgi:hypothetical protein